MAHKTGEFMICHYINQLINEINKLYNNTQYTATEQWEAILN